MKRKSNRRKPRLAPIIRPPKEFFKKGDHFRYWLKELKYAFKSSSPAQRKDARLHWLGSAADHQKNARIQLRKAKRKWANGDIKLIMRITAVEEINLMYDAQLRVDYLSLLDASTVKEKIQCLKRLKKSIDGFEKTEKELERLVGKS